MDNANKAIMVGVGLFITIIVISAVLLIVNLGRNTVNEGAGQLQGLSDSMKTLVMSNYAGKKLTGTEVISAIKQFENENMMVVIQYKPSATSTSYSSASTGNYFPTSSSSSSWTNYSSMGQTTIVSTTYSGGVSKLSSNYKIQPSTYLQFDSKTFYATAIVDTNGNVRGIVFVEKA